MSIKWQLFSSPITHYTLRRQKIEMLINNFIYFLINLTFLNKMALGYETDSYMPQRRSEYECAKIYFKDIHNTHHKSKRDTWNYNNGAANDMYDHGDATPVVEETIKKTTISKNYIVGGTRTREHEFPFMCALGWKFEKDKPYSYNCGCVLIAEEYALTAAHCEEIKGFQPLVAKLGDEQLNAVESEVIPIQEFIKHPERISSQNYHDIAIVHLQSKSRQKPACLWDTYEVPNQNLVVLGYGYTRYGGRLSNNLLMANLQQISDEDCKKYYMPGKARPYGLGPGHLCAGDPLGNKDTCQGDSGGPLITMIPIDDIYVAFVVGLTSFGAGCATGAPGVYSRISYYVDWIESVVWNQFNQ